MHPALHVSGAFVASARLDSVGFGVPPSRLLPLLTEAVVEQCTDTTLYVPLQMFPAVNHVLVLQFPKRAMASLLRRVDSSHLHVVVDDSLSDDLCSLTFHPSAPLGAKLSVHWLRSLASPYPVEADKTSTLHCPDEEPLYLSRSVSLRL